MERKKYAVIDLEATDSHPKRIIEVAIVTLWEEDKELKLKGTWNTLVNPEEKLSNIIKDLTGILDQPLREAPKFFEIAEEIELLTRDHILVAHNVNFDYSLLESEFEKLGINFKRKTLCTQELSKTHFPSLPGHDLDTLSQFLSINVPFRHRALDDALAAAQILGRVYGDQREKGDLRENTLFKLHLKHPTLDLNKLSQLKPQNGLLYLFNKGQVVTLIQCENLFEQIPLRLLSSNDEFDRFDFRIIDDPITLRREYISKLFKLRPANNKDLKQWGVFLQTAKSGNLSLRTFPVRAGKGEILFLSDSKRQCENWVRDILSKMEKPRLVYIDENDVKAKENLLKEKNLALEKSLRPFRQYPQSHFSHQRIDGNGPEHHFKNNRLIGIKHANGHFQKLGESPLLRYTLLKFFRDLKEQKTKSSKITSLKQHGRSPKVQLS